MAQYKVPTNDQWATLAKKLSPSRAFYGTSTTAAGVATKVVDCSEFKATDLTIGTRISITMTYAQTSTTQVYLNVNSTGAKKLYKYQDNANTANAWDAKETIDCVYDGLAWCMIGGGVSNTEITNMLAKKQDTLVSGTNLKTVNNQSLLGSGNVSISVPTIENSTGSSTTAGISQKAASDAITAVTQAVNGKQDALVSGTNIKTVNSNSLLGSGNVSVGTITSVQANGTNVATSGTANIPAASTSAYGVTKLYSGTDSTSTSLAATASAVKSAYDLANGKGNGTITAVQANGTNVATSGTANIPSATTSRYGVTQLSSSTSSTSTSLAATASAVKLAYDAAGWTKGDTDSVGWTKWTNKDSVRYTASTTTGFGITAGWSCEPNKVSHGALCELPTEISSLAYSTLVQNYIVLGTIHGYSITSGDGRPLPLFDFQDSPRRVGAFFAGNSSSYVTLKLTGATLVIEKIIW